MEPNNSSAKSINRRQLIKKISHITLGATGVFTAMGVEYQKPTLKKLLPLKVAAAQASSSFTEG